MMRVGAMTIDPIVDGELVTQASVQYPNLERRRWEAHRQYLVDGHGVINSIGGFMVRTAERIVIVDAGIGSDPVKPWNGGSFRTSLLSFGVAPSDVTDVLFTHLHLDHIGWATQRGEPFFPNAAYRCDARDWDHFCSKTYEPPEWEVALSNPEDRASIRLGPVRDRLTLWRGDAAVLPGITAVDAAGHTPGHSVLLLSSKGEQGMLIGDLAHWQPELLEDDWDGVADIDPAASRVALRRIRTRLVEESIPFAAAHFAGMPWGRIVAAGGRISWVAETEGQR